ncbi:unnamed protein product [Moneuplotes crassus]|uniref:Uncharacterized protein n=1 Tax=Euplotes crassus TaxID=5936 RepID=A0AAD1X8V5_EUPCR|nr:unnamed protein product [Moneuplotes crassus]
MHNRLRIIRPLVTIIRMRNIREIMNQRILKELIKKSRLGISKCVLKNKNSADNPSNGISKRRAKKEGKYYKCKQFSIEVLLEKDEVRTFSVFNIDSSEDAAIKMVGNLRLDETQIPFWTAYIEERRVELKFKNLNPQNNPNQGQNNHGKNERNPNSKGLKGRSNKKKSDDKGLKDEGKSCGGTQSNLEESKTGKNNEKHKNFKHKPKDNKKKQKTSNSLEEEKINKPNDKNSTQRSPPKTQHKNCDNSQDTKTKVRNNEKSFSKAQIGTLKQKQYKEGKSRGYRGKQEQPG